MFLTKGDNNYITQVRAARPQQLYRTKVKNESISAPKRGQQRTGRRVISEADILVCTICRAHFRCCGPRALTVKVL